MAKYSYEHYLDTVEEKYAQYCGSPFEREIAKANMRHPDGRDFVRMGWTSFFRHPLSRGTVEATFDYETEAAARCMFLYLGDSDMSHEYEQGSYDEEITYDRKAACAADNMMTLDEYKEQVGIELAQLLGCDASSEVVSGLMDEKDSQDVIDMGWGFYNKRIARGRSSKEAVKQESAGVANFIYLVVRSSLLEELVESKGTMTREEFGARVEYVLAGYKRTPIGDPVLAELIDDELSQIMIEVAWEGYSELELSDSTQREDLMQAAKLAAGCISSNVRKKHKDMYEKEPYIDDVELLIAQSRDEDWGVRCKAAKNPNAPIEILEMLSRDENPRVRRGVARNPRTTPPIFDALAERGTRDAQILVAVNPRTSSETLAKLASACDGRVRWNVARNQNTSLETIIRQSDDEFDQVREAVAVNPITPDDVLAKLSDDEEERVRLCAKSAMRRRAGQMSNSA